MVYSLFAFAVFTINTLFSNYFEAPLSEHLIFQVRDGWCEETQGVGAHCFGDFGLPWQQIRDGDPYVGDKVLASNPPIFILLFKHIFGSLSYNLGLFGYLGTAFLVTFGSLFLLANKLGFGKQDSLAFGFLGLSSVGFLSSFDRGNHVWMILPFLAWAILAERSDSQIATVISFSLLASLKFWAPVFFLILVFRKKFSQLLGSVLLTLSINLAAVASLSDLPIEDRFRAIFNGLLSESVSQAVIQYAISPYALVLKLNCEFVMASCTPEALGVTRLGTQWLAILFGSLVILLASWISYKARRDISIWLPVLLLPILALPEAGIYNLILLPIAFVLAEGHYANVGSKKPDTYWFRWLAVCMSTPFALDFGLIGFSVFGELALSWKIHAFLVPILASIWLLLAAFWTFRRSTLSIATSRTK